ncbi:MAG TPA: hypothetical protein VMU24_04775 [Candidatus Acidoferrales bacterium]|nr:hypothetical protein [Candidatus Acidoferrales bacterium]
MAQRFENAVKGECCVMLRSTAIGFLAMCFVIAASGQTVRPQRTFAPYLDMGKTFNNLPAVQAQSGSRWTTLAFINAGDGCQPAWPGTKSLADDNTILGYVKDARSRGGKVILAFGGYEGTELAMACPDAKSLANAYSQAARRYRAQVLDFDVEHFAIEDQASIDRRSEAISILEKSDPKLRIQFTLPATPKGLTAQSMNLLQNAATHNVQVHVVNVMAMDYAIPMTDGGMGAAAISAVDAAREQIRQLGMKSRLGITPMIGVNDSSQETFTLADAQQVVDYAKQHDDIALLAFWSLGRDNGSCIATVSPTCSGITQEPWAFTKIFLGFR